LTNRILVIDDEAHFLVSVKRGLAANGFRSVTTESDPEMAMSIFEKDGPFDIALIDLTMPVINGLQVLNFIKKTSPITECIMITAVNEATAAMECLKKGAYDYLVKPISSDDLLSAIKRALERKKLLEIVDLTKKTRPPQLESPWAFKDITTQSEALIRLMREAELHAASNVPVLITGESGTGKELLARAIHSASQRADKTFTAINMASLTGNLFEAEFFGHTRGAFTGAEKDREGYLEYTRGGTLFLDEIGIMPPELQGKLLRVLQEKEYLKLGTNHPRLADVRFIAATNADLDQLMAEGRFRADLYYRLRGAWLHLPPLKKRSEDIALLAERFMTQFCGDKAEFLIDVDAMSMLLTYDYPGNIRELASIIQTAANLAQGNTITVDCLPTYLPKPKRRRSDAAAPERPVSSLADVEKSHILKVFQSTGKNRTRTAEQLGISLNTLRTKLKSFGIS
jgi:DNA-binding NtrC family response regulator